MAAPRAIDFLPRRGAWLFGHAGSAASRRLQAGLLGLAVLALLAALVQAGLRRPAAPVPAPAKAVVAAVPAAASVPALNATERARINRIVRRLNTPWPTIFEALDQQAHAKVALLSLETDAERGAVRVTTEGPSLDELLQHAERVQATPPFERTKLLRIEPPDSAGALPDITRLSFDLVIR